MKKTNKIVSAGLMAAVVVGSISPASAQWGWGWGYGGWDYGGAVAGAAIAGMAVGAVAASAAQANEGYYYGAPAYRRARWCVGNQPAYDDWGGFVGYQRVRYRC